MRLKFNVLCETREQRYHLEPVSPEAEIVDEYVFYGNHRYRFEGFSTGLDS